MQPVTNQFWNHCDEYGSRQTGWQAGTMRYTHNIEMDIFQNWNSMVFTICICHLLCTQMTMDWNVRGWVWVWVCLASNMFRLRVVCAIPYIYITSYCLARILGKMHTMGDDVQSKSIRKWASTVFLVLFARYFHPWLAQPKHQVGILN